MKRSINSLAILATLALLATACQTRLDPAGPYHGDALLWEVDGVIVNGHDALQAFVTWEEDNRPALAAVPSIKLLADRIVAQGPSWFSTALALRDAYKANPSAENKTALDLGTSLLRASIKEALTYLPPAKTPATAKLLK